MNKSEIIQQARSLIDDLDGVVGIQDDQLSVYLEESIKQACLAGNLIKDSSTHEVCNITIEAGQNIYDLHPKIIDVYRARLSTERELLEKSGYKMLDTEDPLWITREGSPDRYCLDYDSGKLVLSHLPQLDGLLSLTVSRLPLLPLSADTDVPEISEYFHFDLVWWILKLVYSTRDEDYFNPSAAKEAEQKFVNAFGIPRSANDITMRLRRYPRRSRARFI